MLDVHQFALLDANRCHSGNTRYRRDTRTGGWSWRGYYFNNIFCGVYFDNPHIIVFANKMGEKPTFKEEFNIEKEHFLAFSKDEQFESLVKFVMETYSNYQKLSLDETAQASIKPTEKDNG